MTTAPRQMQHTVPFEGDDDTLQAPESDVSQSASTSSVVPPASSRAQVAQILEGLHRQLAAPRTPLLPSMDLFQSSFPPQQKSKVDTLPPHGSVPPPAPYPAEAPQPRPSVVPPVRQPHSVSPPGIYTAPVRQSNPPPPMVVPAVRPSNPPPPMYTAPASPPSEPPRERFSSAPPAPFSEPPRERFSSPPPRERLSSAPPQSSGRGLRHVSNHPPSPYAATAPQPLSAAALRREAQTIPADVLASQPPPYDPSNPIPSLRVPSFAPQSFGPDPIRHQENRRLGSVAFVLLVGLLIVTGAIMGVNYAAKGNREKAQTTNDRASDEEAPKVKLERLSPNAIVAPPARSDGLGSTEPVKEQTSSVGAPNTQPTVLPNTPAKDPIVELASPWGKPTKPASASRANQPKSATSKKGSRKRLDPKSIDTETPLIMD